jgi:hypothetical protein
MRDQILHPTSGLGNLVDQGLHPLVHSYRFVQDLEGDNRCPKERRKDKLRRREKEFGMEGSLLTVH